jgi:hypothetical protein
MKTVCRQECGSVCSPHKWRALPSADNKAWTNMCKHSVHLLLDIICIAICPQRTSARQLASDTTPILHAASDHTWRIMAAQDAWTRKAMCAIRQLRLQCRARYTPEAYSYAASTGAGQPLSTAHCSSSWCPLLAAQVQVPASHGQPLARSHCSTCK